MSANWNTPELQSAQADINPVLVWLAYYLATLPPQPEKPIPLITVGNFTPDGIELASQFSPQPENQIEKSAETTEQPEIQQIPHDGDKLIMVLNFLLREVMPLDSKEDQHKLLKYYFRAILSESMLSPFTSLAYSINLTPTGEIKIYDDIYQLRPDVLQVCQTAMGNVVKATEKRRYGLEHIQLVSLIEQIHTLFMAGYPPQALIEFISQTTTDQQPAAESVFTAFGWQKATNLVTPEAAHKLELPTNQLECFAGKKIIYLMPQSEVHAGNMSVLVVAQPIFIPGLNRLVLLHDQCFYPAEWSQHLQLMKKLGVIVPPEIEILVKKSPPDLSDIHQIEAFVMSQVITLEDHQLSPAKLVLHQLIDHKSPLIKLKEQWKQAQLKGMDESLHWYAELVIRVMEKETAEKYLRPQHVEKICIFLKRIVLAGILTKEKINQSSVEELLTLYEKHAHKGEERFSIQAAQSFGFSAAIATIDTSLLECVSIGTIQGFGVNKFLSQLRLNPRLATRESLAEAIGWERAQLWHEHQTCIGCGVEDTWVGECSLCLTCEIEASATSAPETSSEIQAASKPKKPISEPTPLTETPSPSYVSTTSVGGFFASLI